MGTRSGRGTRRHRDRGSAKRAPDSAKRATSPAASQDAQRGAPIHQHAEPIHQHAEPPYPASPDAGDVAHAISADGLGSGRAFALDTGAIQAPYELKAVFEAIADGVIVYDAEGRVAQANQTGRALLGLNARPDLDERSASERGALLNMRDEHGVPLLPDQFPVRRALHGEILTGAHAVDIVLRSLDGREWEANISAAPVRDAAGRISGVVTVFRDVTERRALERRSAEVVQALLAMANTFVLAADDSAHPSEPPSSGVARRLVELTQRVLGCATVAMVSVDPANEIPRPVAVIGLGPDHEREWWTAWDGGYNLAEVFGRKSVARLRAGEAVLLDLRAPAFQNRITFGLRAVLLIPMRIGEQLIGVVGVEHGAPEHVYSDEELAIARAVAELAGMVVERSRLLRERMEAQASEVALRRANRQLDDFLGIVSHELRQPLASIRGYVQLAERRLKTGETQLAPRADARPAQVAAGHGAPGQPRNGATANGTESADASIEAARAALQSLEVPLERATEQTALLNRLIGDLLDASRIQRGTLEIRPELCDLAALLSRAIDNQRQAHPASAIRLDVVGGAQAFVSADPARIEQVVINFVSNALRYSPPQHPVDVRLDLDGDEARVSVRDYGPGLPDHERERIWERFYRAQGAEAHGSGLGLGLYISRMIIERQGGRIGVQSTLGQGCTFWFSLPRAPAS
jgi:signal transduction histidine kinase/PAS domain-containing protein